MFSKCRKSIMIYNDTIKNFMKTLGGNDPMLEPILFILLENICRMITVLSALDEAWLLTAK